MLTVLLLVPPDVLPNSTYKFFCTVNSQLKGLFFVILSEQYCSYIQDQNKITNNKTRQLHESVWSSGYLCCCCFQSSLVLESKKLFIPFLMEFHGFREGIIIGMCIPSLLTKNLQGSIK